VRKAGSIRTVNGKKAEARDADTENEYTDREQIAPGRVPAVTPSQEKKGGRLHMKTGDR